MYYRGAAAAVVVFDVTNRDTFEGAKSWVRLSFGAIEILSNDLHSFGIKNGSGSVDIP